jgi:hypothetical protein
VLRRVENASIEYRYGLIFAKRGHVRLYLGHKMYKVGRITLMDFRRVKLEQLTCPVQVCTDGEQIYWHLKDRFYWENEDLNADEVYALLVTRRQRERGSRIEPAQTMVAVGMRPQDQAQRRDVIPDDMKQLVWLGDAGRCRQRGAQTELQHDHIIPVVMGAAAAIRRTCRYVRAM